MSSSRPRNVSLKLLNEGFDRWLLAPERNALGRLGLFRVVYASFYLWHLSSHFAAIFSVLPQGMYWNRRFPFGYWDLPPSLPLVLVLESMLVASLVLLLIGYGSRLATASVLVFGGLLDALQASVDLEQGTVFLAVYIPLFMLVAGRWGEAHSLDALLRSRRGRDLPDPRASVAGAFVTPRCLLIVLSLLFGTAAMAKLFGTWLAFPPVLGHLILVRAIDSVVNGYPVNPLAPWIAREPLVYNGLRWMVILFEGTFFLALFHPKLRSLYLSLALVFHAISAIWLIVTFTPVLIVYGLFVDWQALLDRSLLGRLTKNWSLRRTRYASGDHLGVHSAA